MNTTMTHNELFDDVPVGGTVRQHWAAQPTALLDAAAAKIVAHGADPWVFSADERHFWQFARAADKAAMLALTSQEHMALLGPWGDEEFDPPTATPVRTADAYFTHDTAVDYVARRYIDAAALRSTMQWSPYIDGIMRCEIYGHAILWDVRAEVLHPGTEYELTPLGASAPLTGSLQQVLAFILARNW